MIQVQSAGAETSGRFWELMHWLTSLDPSFAFLLALPFLVGFAGLMAEYVRHRRAKADFRNHHSTNHGSP